MIRRGEGGGAARGAAFIALMVARVAYFSFQDGELVQCSICKKRQYYAMFLIAGISRSLVCYSRYRE